MPQDSDSDQRRRRVPTNVERRLYDTAVTRCLFTVALLFGLALSIAVVALWVRSYSIGDQINFDEPFDGDSLISNNGRIVLNVSSMGGNVGHWRFDPAHDAVTADTYGIGREHAGVRLGEFAFAHFFEGSLPVETFVLIIPDWLISFATVALLVASSVMLKRLNRFCGDNVRARCGYDLRASANRCPECGTTKADVSGSAASEH